MDIISFNEAATANSRIESFNANPDSTSGVVTVPTTIAAGETITIPAGRMAILPDLQIDGDLVVDGEVFIPNGTSLSKVVEKVPSTDNAIVRYDGTTGAVQNSGVTINDKNWVNVGGYADAYIDILASNNGISENIFRAGMAYVSNGLVISKDNFGNMTLIYSNQSGANTFTIDSAGNVLVTGGGRLGYGNGSGGSVTQLTSKSTAVALHKPTGQIIMNNEALASGAIVYFNLYNSLIGSNDTIIINMDRTTGDLGKYKLEYNTTSGIVLIKLTNQAGASYSDALVLKFTVIKGANS